MRKFFLLLLFLFSVGFAVYALMTAPGRLKQVELVVVEKHGNWRDQIDQYIVSLVQPGESVSPLLVEELKERLSSLPWVKREEIEVRGDKLTIKIWETPPAFYLYFNGNFYLIGDNDFVLERGQKKEKNLPIYYYSGKNSPFTMERGFLKLRKTVKMEIKLVKTRIKELTLQGEAPQVILSDAFVSLIFKRGRIIVYLGAEENSWSNFLSFLSKARRLEPGVYDFRFYDILTRRRKKQ